MGDLWHREGSRLQPCTCRMPSCPSRPRGDVCDGGRAIPEADICGPEHAWASDGKLEASLCAVARQNSCPNELLGENGGPSQIHRLLVRSENALQLVNGAF